METVHMYDYSVPYPYPNITVIDLRCLKTAAALYLHYSNYWSSFPNKLGFFSYPPWQQITLWLGLAVPGSWRKKEVTLLILLLLFFPLVVSRSFVLTFFSFSFLSLFHSLISGTHLRFRFRLPRTLYLRTQLKKRRKRKEIGNMRKRRNWFFFSNPGFGVSYAPSLIPSFGFPRKGVRKGREEGEGEGERKLNVDYVGICVCPMVSVMSLISERSK